MDKIQKLFGLTGKNIIVAGGAGQIGFALSEILAAAGANVAIADLDIDLAEKKLRMLSESYSNRIKLFSVDVTDSGSITTLFQEVEQAFGRLSGIVNSFHFKGNSRKLDISSNFFADFEDYPLEAWEKVHDVNLKGTFLMCQRAVPYFKKSGEGVIVNLSSTYGNVSPNKSIYGNSGINSPVAYASSKSAIINLTRYLATHLAEFNIRANVLSPGGVFNNQSQEFIQNYCKLTPLQKMASPDDYQGAILFLMSDASKYMTGANLIIDGGWTAW